MLAATKVKMSGSKKKVNRTTYNISAIKRVTGKFLGVSRCRRAKQWQRNVQKSVLQVKSFFLLIRPIFCFCFVLFFFCFHCRRRRRRRLVSITRFYILFQ